MGDDQPDQPDQLSLPDWVKGLGLAPEAAAPIDRYWKPSCMNRLVIPRSACQANSASPGQ